MKQVGDRDDKANHLGDWHRIEILVCTHEISEISEISSLANEQEGNLSKAARNLMLGCESGLVCLRPNVDCQIDEG